MREDVVTCLGEVEMVIDYLDGRQEVQVVPNSVLRAGRSALASTLANQLGTEFSFYVTRMLFGDGGTKSGVKRYVDGDRNGLFGVTRLSKPVLSNLNTNSTTQVIFTSVINFDEAVGVVLNEMALQMASGDIYSMTTFADLTKTAEMAITFNWRISYV